MAFCSKCGTQIGENEKFCPNCGNPVEAPAAQAAPQPSAAPAAETFPQDQVEAAKIIAVLMYIFPFLFFLPLVMEPKTEYGKFHANQALLLFIFEIICTIIPIIGWILSVVALVFAILGIVNAVKGVKKGLPLIGGITIIK